MLYFCLGIYDVTSKDTLSFYFENTRRSGGGDIEDIGYEAGSGVAYITFSDPTGIIISI